MRNYIYLVPASEVTAVTLNPQIQYLSYSMESQSGAKNKIRRGGNKKEKKHKVTRIHSTILLEILINNSAKPFYK